MGIFGMSDKELKEFAQKLEAQELQLKNRESDIKRDESNLKHEQELLAAAKATFDKEKTDYYAQVKEIDARIADSNADLEDRTLKVVKLEAEAKAGFARAQEEAFKAVIEQRISELDARQANLDKLSKKIADDLSKVIAREGEVSRRELDVIEREQKADAGFADRAQTLAAEAERQSVANQTEADRLKEREKALTEEIEKLQKEKEAVRQREQKITEAEIERDAGYAEARAALDEELKGKRTEWQDEVIRNRTALQQEITAKKQELIADLEKEIAVLREDRLAEVRGVWEKERSSMQANAEAEAHRIREEIKEEREAWDTARIAQQADLKAQNEANEKKAAELSAKEDHLLGKEHEIQATERNLESLRNQQEMRVEELVADRKASLDADNASLKEEIQRLRDSLKVQTELTGVFEQLKRQLGDQDPAEILRDLNFKTDEIKRLRDELGTRPSEEMREKFEILEKETKAQKERIASMEAQISQNEAAVSESNNLRRQNNQLELDNKDLAQKAERFEAAANQANENLKRFLSAYKRPAEVAARYNEIEMPHFSADSLTPVKSIKKDELDWLNGIAKDCDDYGLHFPMRILKAFHTAIKTAEWSPITILAGVSGTGKSELPRLYSHFGGLLYEPLSVQPNWDSQESMLGFFNSIDNKFDAQPVLRFLAQSQQPANETYEKRIARWQSMAQTTLNFDSDDEEQQKLLETLKNITYPGLQDYLCMVLLDEMNLAHPELYFAEFLSKLELRRGKSGKVVPRLPVKIGAGLPPYQLPLGRNVLWVGTMNQDETTKSLSDKVLDRSIIIYFPRPVKLKRRQSLQDLAAIKRAPLHKKDFQSWMARESEFTDEQIKPYKEFVEDMNRHLGVAGRAIGHRVWQSVEYYMANYPDVRAARNGGDEAAIHKAMHIAFEDQLVQKIMPKLRGIDTNGKMRTECLDKILGQLNTGINGNPFNLQTDFDLACELGYGQFIWQSANYLGMEEDSVEDAKEEEEDSTTNESRSEIENNENSTANADLTTPPEGYRPGDPTRETRWEKMSTERKLKWLSDFNEHQRQNQQ